MSSTDAEGLQEDSVTAYCAKYGAAACADVVAPNAGTGVWSKISSGIGGAALGTATTLSRDTHPDDDDDCGCGPDTRFEAYKKALAWAGMSIGNEGTPIPWSQYNGRGALIAPMCASTRVAIMGTIPKTGRQSRTILMAIRTR